MNKDKPEYSDDVQRAINSELDEIIEMIKRRKGRVE
jgi:protein associated with RNAse G/E